MDGNFEYVLEKIQKPKICFGSGCARDTSRKGMTPFMRYYTLENHANISPCSYNTLRAFKAIKAKPCLGSISKKGYGGLARYSKNIVHYEKYPSPCAYNVSDLIKNFKQTKYPFNSTVSRDAGTSNKNPGPGTYKIVEKQKMPFDHSFGGRVKMRLGVDLKCCSRNTDICIMCKNKPNGDYWHWKDKVFLCRPCMAKEKSCKSKYKQRELDLFRKVRDCSTFHSHEDTTAKVWLKDPNIVKKWARKEAYLSLYLKD